MARPELRPLAAAAALSLAAALPAALPLPAQAQPAAAPAYQLPAQPLAQSLAALAAQAGLQLVADPARIGQRMAPALPPTADLLQALRALLAGSGLQGRVQGQTLVITPAPARPAAADAPAANAADAKTLPAVTVQAGAGSDAQTAGRYAARSAPTGRLAQSVADTPRAVSVVPQAVLQDQQVLREEEALRNASGVSMDGAYGHMYMGFQLRGLWADNRTSYLRNGIRWTHLSEPMSFNLERIEVVKGPNAIDYGQSTPGGFVNYVTKQPLREPLRSFSLTGGSHRLGKLEADFSGPLNEDKSLRYRLTGGYEKGGAFTDHVRPERKGLAAALAWDLSARTKLNLSAEYSRLDTLNSAKLPVPDPQNIRSADRVRLGNFYGYTSAPSWAKFGFASAELLHSLSTDWLLRAHLGHNYLERLTQLPYMQEAQAQNGQVQQRFWRCNPYPTHDTLGQLELHGSLRTGPVQHQLVMELDTHQRRVTYYGDCSFELMPPVDIYHPPALRDRLPALDASTTETEKDSAGGLFVQDMMDFGNGWGLQAGLRHDRVKNRVSGERAHRSSPNAALTFKPAPGSLLYLSYASSFEPNFGTRLASGARPAPSQGKQWELGAKQSWLDGRLHTSAALYELRKTNIATDDPSHPDYSVLTGEVRVRGLELEASGQPLPGLELTAQATFMSSQVLADSNAAIVGHAPAGSVRRTAALWASYTLPGTAGRWRVGAGLFHSGRRAASDDGRWFSPGYTTVDAMLGYQINEQLKLRLNVKNLLNKRYYKAAEADDGGFYSVEPGAPRSVMLTVDYRF
ncbi:TonB-dependent siderophore receptor [Vandammella animalimorsus]|uniref:TonB-dependent siderophore receptor n=1 Tax=Vandammella animalimorsus TaxID=2029117 RepID=A0A2A2AQR9_9BURK|nr:TonB-dependent siderophore receptor [Vandammella animalimorsus]